MQVMGLAGWSGSGKTTLMVSLIAELTQRGLMVSSLKHAHHNFDIDQPGKDSHRHRQAGAHEVLVGSRNRWALIRELRGAPEPTLAELIARMTPVDLLLVEGFKHDDYDKIEVHRPALDQPLLALNDERVVAIASDTPPVGALPSLPLYELGDIDAIADFIVGHCALEPARQRSA